jgi:diaminopimelate epimerase
MSKESLRLFKYQALGNSYLVLDPRYGTPAALFDSSAWGTPRPRAELVRLLCDLATGIGSNGLLFGPMPPITNDRFRLLIVNSDGTSAGFSGNGTRIFVRYLMDESIVQPGRTIELEIPEEDRQGGLTWNTARARLPSRRDGIIEITAPHVPRFGLDAVRADPAHASAIRGENGSTEAPRYTFTALSAIGTRIFGSSSAWSSSVPLDIGNPHCVTFVARADHMPTLKALHANDGALHDIAFAQAAPEPVFGNGANLQWVWPESRNRLRVMIYERGEGPTLASGSSACAVACAAFGLGLVDADVDVVMPGGTLAIRLRGRGAEIGSVTLAGNADRVLEGTVSVSLQHAT